MISIPTSNLTLFLITPAENIAIGNRKRARKSLHLLRVMDYQGQGSGCTREVPMGSGFSRLPGRRYIK